MTEKERIIFEYVVKIEYNDTINLNRAIRGIMWQILYLAQTQII